MAIRGFTNLAQKQRSVAYHRPDEVLFYDENETADKDTGTAIRPLSLDFETATVNLCYPLNQRLELGFRDVDILPNDWDSYGSPAPTAETISIAKQVCSTFPQIIQPEIMPERDGSISLHWEGPEISFILFVGPNEYSYKCLVEILGETIPLPTQSIWAAASMIRTSIVE